MSEQAEQSPVSVCPLSIFLNNPVSGVDLNMQIVGLYGISAIFTIPVQIDLERSVVSLGNTVRHPFKLIPHCFRRKEFLIGYPV